MRARVPLRGAQRHPARPDRRPDERAARRLLAQMARIAKAEGVDEVVIGLTYSISPVHTDDYYAERPAAMGACPDVDRLYLKDPGGLLDAATPARARARCSSTASRPRPVELHSHCTIGLAPLDLHGGRAAGFRTLHTAVAPVANGTSNPAAETTLRNLEADGLSHGLDVEALAAVSDALRRARARQGAAARCAGRVRRRATTATRCPAGWSRRCAASSPSCAGRSCSTRRSRSSTRVRAEFGYPIMVTPFSQFVGHAGGDERDRRRALAQVPDEIGALLPRPLRRAARRRPTRTSPTASCRSRARRSCATSSRSRSRARASRSARGISDEELLLRLTMPAEQVDAMLQPRAASAPRRARARAATRSSGCCGARRRARSRYLRVEKGDTLVEWRRAA